MNKSPARALIVTALVMMPLFDLVALLPGNPDVSWPGGLLASLVLQALVAWRLLWHSSLLAWVLAVIVPLLYVLAALLGGFLTDTTVVLSCAIALLQFALLWTRPVLGYVFREQPAPSH